MHFRILLCLFILFVTNVKAQIIEKKVLSPNDRIGADSSATHSATFQLNRNGEANMQSADLLWRPLVKHVCEAHEPQMPELELIDSIKDAKTKIKIANQGSALAERSSNTAVIPTVGANFAGNSNNGHSPMDNHIAISNGGMIVSVANTTIEMDDMSGNTLYFNDILTFFNDPAITNVCDPNIVYDPAQDRFIFFAQECSGASTNSYLLIGFSKSNDPTQGWWTYKISGHVVPSTWFDYPKTAISTNELYISGNCFDDLGNYAESILYQIQKNNGYSGASLSWQYWHNIPGSPFTLLPVSYGIGGAYGPGCYLVATKSSGSSNIDFYNLTDDMTATNEQLLHYSIPTTAYTPSGDALQQGSSCLLDNGDCRTLSGFYLNGILHFVFHSEYTSTYNGINYNRLDVAKKKNTSSTFGLSGYDYSYPSVAAYTNVVGDPSVMIGFGRSASNIYPEIRVVHCDVNMNWSASTLVKSSTSYVSYTSTTKERWGDYTGMARAHASATPSVWMNGMYGTSAHSWKTWIAEIHDPWMNIASPKAVNTTAKVYPNPVVDIFRVSFEMPTTEALSIVLYDMQGRLVKELYSNTVQAGENIFTFNKAALPSGNYMLKIATSSKSISNEIIQIQ
jgi:hypothetical protein